MSKRMDTMMKNISRLIHGEAMTRISNNPENHGFSKTTILLY